MQQELEGARADLAARVEKAEELQQQLSARNAAVKEKVLFTSGLNDSLIRGVSISPTLRGTRWVVRQSVHLARDFGKHQAWPPLPSLCNRIDR